MTTDRVAGAARQFEALMLAQWMKSVHEAGSGWLGTGGDPAGETAMEVAEEQFAQALAQQGGLGLARMVTQALHRSES
jgi:Rod binding domain-containing protein